MVTGIELLVSKEIEIFEPNYKAIELEETVGSSGFSDDFSQWLIVRKCNALKSLLGICFRKIISILCRKRLQMLIIL